MINSGSVRDLFDYSNAKISGPSGLSGGLPDYANVSVQGPSGLGGGLADYGNLGLGQPARFSIPEDSARNLFQTLYDALVYATSEDRRKAVLMLVAAYDLPV